MSPELLGSRNPALAWPSLISSTVAPSRTGHPARLLQAAEVTSGQVGRTTVVDGGDRLLDGGLSVERPGRHDDLHLVVEGDQAEAVPGVQLVDQGEQRGLGGIEASAGHGTTPVQHDLSGGRSDE